MANGPLGGNMGTPPVPPQPPQVSFETTAQSRGNFNNFLKSMPNTTSMTPIPPMGSSPMMPAPDPMANIDIFNQPPSMGMGMMGMNQPPMNPMMQPPMQQQPMMMADGGGVPPRRTEIMGQDHMLSYITPEEGGILKALGGAGKPGPMGIPSFYETAEESEGTTESEVSEAQEASGGYGDDNNEESIVGDDPVAGIDFSPGPGVGGGSFDVVSTPPSTPEEQAMNQAISFGLMQGKGLTNVRNVGPRSNVVYSPQFTADLALSRGFDPSTVMSPADFSLTSQGQAQAQAQMDDARSIDQALNQAPATTVSAANVPSTYSPAAFGLGNIVDDPFGLGVVTGFGPVTDAMVSGMYGASANPQAGTQVAGPGFDPSGNLSTVSSDKTGLSNIADSLKGGSMVSYDPVANTVSYTNPMGNFSKEMGISVAPSVDIAPVAPAMPVGRPDNLMEITAANRGIDLDDLRDAAADRVGKDFSMVDAFYDPAGNLTPDAQQQFSKEVDSLVSDTVFGAPTGIDVTTGLDVASLAPAATTTATVDPKDFTGLMSSRDTAPADLDLSINPADFTGLMSSRDVAPAATTPTTDSIVEAAIKDAVPSRSISDILSAMNQKTDLQSQVAQSLAKSGVISGGRTSFSPDVFDPTSLQISDMVQTIGPEVPSGFSPVGSGISPSFTADQVAQSEVDQAPSSNALGFASSQGIPGYDFSMTDINPNTAVEAGSKGIGASVNTSPAPPGFEEQVGKPYSGTPIGQIESFYNAPTTMTQLGVPPGMINSALSVFENLAKDAVASDLISGLYDPIVDRDGNITGSRNPRTGAVQSGMDFNATDTSSNENDNPFILKKKAEEEEKEEEDKPPNVIGGGDPITLPTPKSVVVDSPFTSNVSDFVPSTFNTGDINKLIEMLTGIAAPKSMKKGGVAGYAEGGKVMQALDNLLATA